MFRLVDSWRKQAQKGHEEAEKETGSTAEIIRAAANEASQKADELMLVIQGTTDVKEEPFILRESRQFDCFGTGDMTVEVRDYPESTKLVISGPDETFVLLEAHMDQWGTWYYANYNCIPQEWGMRSFIDALQKGLTTFRSYSEGETLEATYLAP